MIDDNWYIAKKDNVGIDIGDPDMIEAFAKLGYEIYKMQEVKVDDIDKELAAIEANAMLAEQNPNEEN